MKIIEILVSGCSLMRARSELTRYTADALDVKNTSTSQVAQRTPHVVETDPRRGAVERRSKCCIFVQKSSIIEQNHDFETTVDYQNHNISKKHRCNVKTPS